MARFGCLGWALLVVAGCADDGHVVGEMETDGGAGAATITATSSGGTTQGTSSASDADASTGTSTSTAATTSGGSGTGGSASESTAQASTGTAGTGGASGGSAGADSTSGGSSGASGETATSSSDPCPPGQVWCPGCTPGEGICSAGGCPGIACAQCAYIETLEECEVEYGCHPVFEDPGTCGCAGIGCCARFASCAQGSQADCVGPANCERVTPFCDDPAYVVSYANGCFEGCVRPEICAE